MLWEILCRKKKEKKKKLAKSKTRKGGLSQKWASRWIENPKGRSRQKLGAYKNIISVDWKPERAIQAKVRDLQKNNTKKMMMEKKNKKKDRGITVQVGQMEECTLCWFTNGNFCQIDWLMGFYPEKWRLLPMVWWMATLACDLIDGVFCCLWFDEWRLLPMVRLMASFAACDLMNGDFSLWFDWWRLLPPVIWWMATLACALIDGVFCRLWFDWWQL